jgi:hypothetical protein
MSSCSGSSGPAVVLAWNSWAISRRVGSSMSANSALTFEQAGALPLRLAENAGEHEPEHALGMVDRGCAAPPSCPSNGPR